MIVPSQNILLPESDVTLIIRREDLIHPFVSGNKFRKLKYNLREAKAQHFKTLLTFGGAYSNHIAAVAFAGKENGFATIGIIRGDELADQISVNPTLQFAQKCGMTLVFISRSDYRLKEEDSFLEDLNRQLGAFYLIPEGGTNELAIRGCEEILTPEDAVFDYICCAVGTGGTISGLIKSALPHQKILGFPSLKGSFLDEEIRKFVLKDNWALLKEYHFGGYGKVSRELIEFINDFRQKNDVALDPIYTGKMLFGVMDLIQNRYFPKGSTILAIHTGGIQGIQGMNLKLKNKNLPIIETND